MSITVHWAGIEGVIRLPRKLINEGAQITFSDGKIRTERRCENVYYGSLGEYIGCDTEL